MHLLSYHPSIVVATTRWIFYKVAFLDRDAQFLPFIYTTILSNPSNKHISMHKRMILSDKNC